MIKNIYIYLNLFFIFIGFNLPVFNNAYAVTKDNQNQITVDYLKNLPKSDYIIGPGDELGIIVSRDYPELSSIAQVDGEGTIYLPRLYRIFVNGLTLNELNNVLNEAYKKFVKFPEVEVKVKRYRPIRVLVKGEVENPGLITLEGAFSVNKPSTEVTDFFPIEENKMANLNTIENTSKNNFFPTVFDAIRNSGGITQFTDLSNVQVIRKNSISAGGGKIKTTLNFENLLLNGDNSQNIRIYNEDIIVLGKSNVSNTEILRKATLSKLNPRFLNVFVTGRVNRPGKITVSKASVLSDAIIMAGGTKALKGRITFIRFNKDGSIDKRKFAYRKMLKRGGFKNPILKEGDLIIIGETFLTMTNEVVSEITAPLTGIFSTYGLYKIIND